VPTPQRNARLTDELLESVRHLLGLPADANASQIIRAGLEKLIGADQPTGQPTGKAGRPVGRKDSYQRTRRTAREVASERETTRT